MFIIVTSTADYEDKNIVVSAAYTESTNKSTFNIIAGWNSNLYNAYPYIITIGI